MTIRQETKDDHRAVHALIEDAFANEKLSDHQEQHLVDRLRRSDAFIPELSLIAETDGKVVGHILLTQVWIENQQTQVASLALAPVSVLPKYQGQGIGSALIQKAHSVAKELEYKSVILLGHTGYYERFGYRPASTYGIELPFEAPLENCMAVELEKDALKEVSGMVEYAKEFYEK